MKTLVIHGAYKGDNFGDTLLLGILANEANRIGWHVLASRTCKASAAHLHGISNIERLTHWRQLNKAQALVYGGGGFLGEQPLNHLQWHLQFIKNHIPVGLWFWMRRKPYGCIGTGLGPLSFGPSRRLITFLLKRAGVVCLRDEESKAYLAQYGVPERQIDVSADLALTLADGAFPQISRYNFPRTGRGPVVLLHPSYDADQDAPQEQLAQHLKLVLAAHPEAELWLMDDAPCRNPDNNKGWKHLLNISPERIFLYKSPWETCALIKSADIVISNKLHVGIVAATYGKIVLSVAKHPKNKRFFDQINRPELCQMRDAFDSSLFTSQLTQALTGKLPAISVPPAVLQESRKNFEKLQQLLAQS